MKPDYSKPDSFPNWVTAYHMECAEKSEFGLFGSLFFFGVVLGAATLPRVSDTLGRRPLVIFGATMHLICALIVLLSTSRILTYAMYFMLGFCMMGRAIIGFIWATEHMMEKHVPRATSIAFGLDSLCIAIVSLYFMNTPKSNHWMWPFGLPLIGLLGVIFLVTSMTDSPKFYYGIGDYDKCRDVLTRIGRLNGYLDDDEHFREKFLVEIDQEKAGDSAVESHGAADFLADPTNKCNLLIFIVLGVACSFSYYLLNFYMKYMPGDIFENQIANSLAEALANASAVCVVTCVSMRKGFSYSFVVAVISSCCLLFARTFK